MSNLQQQSVDRPAKTNLSVSRTPDAFSPATISIPAVDSPADRRSDSGGELDLGDFRL